MWSSLNSIGAEEALYIFPSLANSIRNRLKMLDGEDIKRRSTIWDDCSKLRQLAERTKTPWYIVQSLLLLQHAHYCPPSEPFAHLVQAAQIMLSVSPEETASFVVDGQAVVPFLLMLYGIALFIAGKYDESERMWNKGKELAVTYPSVRLSCEMLQIGFQYVR
jgi:hypothetical protein